MITPNTSEIGTSSLPMGTMLSLTRGMGYRPVTLWQKKASGRLRLGEKSIRATAEITRKRTVAFLESMVEAGALDLAATWLADFEAAFCTVRQSWTDAFKIATAADANQDMAVAELVAERTDECERLYLLALEKETAAKLVEIMLLKRKRAAR